MVGLLRALCDHGPGLLDPLLDSLGGGGGGLGDLHVGLPVCHLGEQKKKFFTKINKFKFTLQTTHMLRNSYKDNAFKNCEKCVEKQ